MDWKWEGVGPLENDSPENPLSLIIWSISSFICLNWFLKDVFYIYARFSCFPSANSCLRGTDGSILCDGFFFMVSFLALGLRLLFSLFRRICLFIIAIFYVFVSWGMILTGDALFFALRAGDLDLEVDLRIDLGFYSLKSDLTFGFSSWDTRIACSLSCRPTEDECGNTCLLSS